MKEINWSQLPPGKLNISNNSLHQKSKKEESKRPATRAKKIDLTYPTVLRSLA